MTVRAAASASPRPRRTTRAVGDERDPALQVEREALKLALQSPELVHTWFGAVSRTGLHR
jgi:hypothetical protein